jgi:hypothetical protein
MMLTPVISDTWKVTIRRIMVWGHPGKKVSKTASQQNKLGFMAYTCHTSYMGGIGRKITV